MDSLEAVQLIDERNAMAKSVLQFKEVERSSLAGFKPVSAENRSEESHGLHSDSKPNDPYMFSDHLDERNEIMDSIMYFDKVSKRA